MPKIYSEEKRLEIKRQIMLSGLKLLQIGGLKKMSIEEITKQVGISQGAFYSFFESKESLVYALVNSYQERINRDFDNLIKNLGLLKREDLRTIYHNMIFKDEDNIYRYIKREDLTQLLSRLPREHHVTRSDSFSQIERNMSFVSGKKEQIDTAAIINWIQIMHLVLENKDILIESGLEKTIGILIENMLDEIFKLPSEGKVL